MFKLHNKLSSFGFVIVQYYAVVRLCVREVAQILYGFCIPKGFNTFQKFSAHCTIIMVQNVLHFEF